MSPIIPFYFYSFSMSVTPGPNNLMLLSSGLNFGVKRSIWLYTGICLGATLMAFLVMLFVGHLIQLHPNIQIAMKVFGLSYGSYLAYKIGRSSGISRARLAKPMGFFEAVAIQWLNPKSLMVFVSTISLFTLSDNPVINAAILSLTAGFNCAISSAGWLVLGQQLQKWLKTDHHRFWFNQVMAGALVLCLLLVAFE